MRTPALKRLLLAGVVLGLATCGDTLAQRLADDGIVIEDVTLISPERPAPLPHVSVVIREGRIAEIDSNLVAGPHATRIDGRGRFLIPGLIDSHVHLGNIAWLDDDLINAHPELVRAYRSQLPRAYLAFGFTTLIDLNLQQETLWWFNANPNHPNLYHCGPAVHVAGGYGAQRIPKDTAAANRANLVYQAAQATDWPPALDPAEYTPARAVERVAQSGGVCVKTFVEPGFGGAAHWPVPSRETLNALRAETRRRGLVFIVHANAEESWRAALNANADVIAHGLWHWPGDQLATIPPGEVGTVIHAAAVAGVGVQPTLQAVYGDQSIFDDSLLADPRLKIALPQVVVRYLNGGEAKAARAAVADEYRHAIAQLVGPDLDPRKVMSVAPERAAASLRIMAAENVKLLFGSDTPSNEGIGNPPGLNGRMEITHWSEAGVSLSRILRAATMDNAAAFGLLGKLGTIGAGKQADLLLLRADPLKTISAYDQIDTIFLNGIPISRSSLSPVN